MTTLDDFQPPSAHPTVVILLQRKKPADRVNFTAPSGNTTPCRKAACICANEMPSCATDGCKKTESPLGVIFKTLAGQSAGSKGQAFDPPYYAEGGGNLTSQLAI